MISFSSPLISSFNVTAFIQLETFDIWIGDIISPFLFNKLIVIVSKPSRFPDKEKPAISAVIHNRYNLELLPADELKKAPLCNPGEESIKAALYPEDNDNIYYVYNSKLDGSHVFTDDEEEYNRLL